MSVISLLGPAARQCTRDYFPLNFAYTDKRLIMAQIGERGERLSPWTKTATVLAFSYVRADCAPRSRKKRWVQGRPYHSGLPSNEQDRQHALTDSKSKLDT
jgi:hypothetical protein